MLEESQIRSIVDQLDRAVPQENTIVRLEQYGGGPDEGRIVANRVGYLRLGIEFLRAGIEAEPCQFPKQIKLGIAQLIDENSSIGFDEFLRDDSLPLRQNSEAVGRGLMRFLAGVGLGATLIGILVLALIGICALFRGL